MRLGRLPIDVYRVAVAPRVGTRCVAAAVAARAVGASEFGERLQACFNQLVHRALGVVAVDVACAGRDAGTCPVYSKPPGVPGRRSVRVMGCRTGGAAVDWSA